MTEFTRWLLIGWAMQGGGCLLAVCFFVFILPRLDRGGTVCYDECGEKED